MDCICVAEIMNTSNTISRVSIIAIYFKQSHTIYFNKYYQQHRKVKSYLKIHNTCVCVCVCVYLDLSANIKYVQTTLWVQKYIYPRIFLSSQLLQEIKHVDYACRIIQREPRNLESVHIEHIEVTNELKQATNY